MRTPFRDRGVNDEGYALVTVIGLGMAILLSVGAVSAYTLQGMRSAGSTQGFHASIQAAQAGVDQFVSKLNTAGTTSVTTYAQDVSAAISAGTDWQPIPGSRDGATAGGGTLCTAPSGGNLPPNCPKFKYTVTPTATGYDMTSTGYSRGDTRTVKVSLRQRSLTDYLYYSSIEAADPTDGFVYPNILGLGLTGPPAGCEYPSWNTSVPSQVRPATGCRIPRWRSGDTTTGSRVHTSDVFAATGSPSFDSKVTVASPGCATNVVNCVTGGSPTYSQGNPTYANDLTLPAAPLDLIAAAALTATGCTYTGPTRIEFLTGSNSGKMKVWSPQSTFATDAERLRCLGTTVPNAVNLSALLNVKVTSSNQGLLGSLLPQVCVLGICVNQSLSIGSTTNLSLQAVLDGSLLGDLTSTLGLSPEPNPIAIPTAIYVKQAAPSSATLQKVQCLLASVAGVGLQSGDLQLGLNGLLGSAGANRCYAGDLYLSGELKGKTTIGTTGNVTIMDNLTYADRSADMLGIVSLGSVEAYNSVQCVLGLGTCMSLSGLPTLLPSVLALLAKTSPTKQDLTDVLHSLGADKPVAVEASILTYKHFGVQLPVLSPSLNVALMNRLVDLNVTPPALNVYGSVAQKYRGLTSADLLSVTTSVSGSAASLDLLSANVDIGFALKMQYDKRLLNQKPNYLPAASTARWDQVSFGEV